MGHFQENTKAMYMHTEHFDQQAIIDKSLLERHFKGVQNAHLNCEIVQSTQVTGTQSYSPHTHRVVPYHTHHA